MKFLVAAVTFVVFLPALGNGFVSWDDDTNFLGNPRYRGLGPAQLAWMFTDLRAHYMPLTWLTLGLDYVLWGMNPVGYHLTSVLLHAANAALFFLVARRLLGAALPAAPGSTLRFGSLVAALLFAVHPLRVESVAWVTERRDVLCGLFYLLALLAYLRYRESGGRRAYLASLALFAAALLSKSMAVTLPAVLLLLDVYPLRRRAWREKIPFFALSAAAGTLALVAQRSAGAMSSTAYLGPLERVAIAFYSLAFYLWKTLIPVRLSPLYELPARVEPVAWPYVASAIVVLALSAVAIAARRRWPAFAVAWASYVVTVLPVSGLVQVGPQIAADRYTYLACLSFAVFAGGALARVRLALRNRRATGVLLFAGAGVLAVALVVLTLNQTRIWRDSETLWSQALAVGPSAIAHAKLGVVRDEQGKPEEAIAHYRAALRIHPDMPDTYNNWGIALARQGRWQEAIEQYENALKLAPGSAETHANLAVALERVGRVAEAAQHARTALRIQRERR
ncbi:MAG: tetratricopeptide repeat protein [Candidatus Rokuibacteriota bacterium]